MSKVRINLIISGLLLLMVSGSAGAQCAMCKATLAGDPKAVAAAHQINMAILLLAIPAIVIFAGFFVAMYRYRDTFRASRPPSTGFGLPSADDFDSGHLSAFRGSLGPGGF